MNIYGKIIMAAVLGVAALPSPAQRYYEGDRERWLRIADECKPDLHTEQVRPRSVVAAVRDSSAFQHWRYDSVADPADYLYGKNFKDVKEVTVDFGRHLTGKLTIVPKVLSRCQDAPVRLRLFMGELPAELNTQLDPWNGTLSRAWMQDEVVTITEIDAPLTLDRRLAGQYLRIELLGASPDFDFGIDDIYLTATTSAGDVKTDLGESATPLIRDINDVSIATLGECMQTVYEDGPKRDRRLWAGDFYLQSLANRHSFRNFDLTKRCLYLFAALAADDGTIYSNLFETPEPHPQYGSHCLSYSLLWNSTLLEYLKDTGDYATAEDLWKVAKRQIDDILTYVDDEGVYNRGLRPDS